MDRSEPDGLQSIGLEELQLTDSTEPTQGIFIKTLNTSINKM